MCCVQMDKVAGHASLLRWYRAVILLIVIILAQDSTFGYVMCSSHLRSSLSPSTTNPLPVCAPFDISRARPTHSDPPTLPESPRRLAHMYLTEHTNILKD